MTSKTRQKYSFFGGVHPPEHKKLTKGLQIRPVSNIKRVVVPLSQHIGSICNPVVSRGDEVTAGQVIGKSDAFFSALIHSPIDGKVKDISLQPHVALGRCMSIVIEGESIESKKPVSDKFDNLFNEAIYSPEEICNAIYEAGIVGMGGAGFPTRVKIEANPRMPKKIMIINGCECEPYITCDYRIMLEWADQIIAGIRLARLASGCQKVIIGIEDNKPKAIEAIQTALDQSEKYLDVQIAILKTQYPQGGERQLIKSVLNTHVPTGGIPPMIGVLVLNVATVAAIAEAVVLKQPLTHRVVTITGEAIARPGNFYLPIGTPVQKLIDHCGGLTKKGAKVVLGGPMTGVTIADLQTPVTKTTGAVTILTKEQIGKAKFKQRQTPCIRCGRCLKVCPEHLNPTQIAHAVKNNLFDMAEDYFIRACIECGCCSYVCPANIELTGYIKTGKIHLAKQKKKVP